jgi:hypothetical protein
LYGYTAQGRTPIRDSNYNGDEGGEEWIKWNQH